MKITRMVNGERMEFELTMFELMDAHREEQANIDKENVTCCLQDMMDELGEDLCEDDATLTKITRYFRHHLDLMYDTYHLFELEAARRAVKDWKKERNHADEDAAGCGR